MKRRDARVTLSIIIPTYGRIESLARLLRAIDAQTARPLEIIVVDQNPPRFLQLPSNLHHVRMAEANAAAARNLGFHVSRGTHVLFLDDDEVPEPDFVARVTRTFSAHAGVRCLWPIVHAPRGEGRALRHWKRRGTGETIAGTSLFRIRRAGSGGIAFEREFFRLTGGYDELLFRFGGGSEDWELAARMRARDLAVWCDASLRLLHDSAERGGCAVRSRPYEDVRTGVTRACLLGLRIANGAPFRLRLRDALPLLRFTFVSSLGRADARAQVLRHPLWHVKMLRRELKTSRRFVMEHAERYASASGIDHLGRGQRQIPPIGRTPDSSNGGGVTPSSAAMVASRS